MRLQNLAGKTHLRGLLSFTFDLEEYITAKI